MCTPFLIRNTDGREFELRSKEAFDRIYGNKPGWYIATGEFRKVEPFVTPVLATTDAPEVSSEPAEAPAGTKRKRSNHIPGENESV